MENSTQLLFSGYCQQIASMNGVSDASKKFTMAPAIVQRMVELIQEESTFLKNINVVTVGPQSGEKLGLGIGSPIAGRTDTNVKERETRHVGTFEDDKYTCVQTDFDTHMPYNILDGFGHLGTDPLGELGNREAFSAAYSRQKLRAVALNQIMIGWNGTSAAKQTDIATNKLLQDVNIGWLEKCRLKKPAHLMGYDSEGVATEDAFKIGEGGQYGTLDAAVFDIIGTILDPWYQEADDLVVILGRELWVNHGLTLYNENRSATERNALAVWFAQRAVAGLPTVSVPHFPKRGLVVTSYDNLSLYIQEGTTRRAIIDNPKRNRVEDYLSSNDAYIIEDFGKFGGFRPGSIQLKNEKGEWY